MSSIFSAVGSGGHFAQGTLVILISASLFYRINLLCAVLSAAALALIDVPDYDADRILRKAMKIAGDACVYTNHNLIVESVDAAPVSDASPATATAPGKKKKE